MEYQLTQKCLLNKYLDEIQKLFLYTFNYQKMFKDKEYTFSNTVFKETFTQTPEKLYDHLPIKQCKKQNSECKTA